VARGAGGVAAPGMLCEGERGVGVAGMGNDVDPKVLA